MPHMARSELMSSGRVAADSSIDALTVLENRAVVRFAECRIGKLGNIQAPG